MTITYYTCNKCSKSILWQYWMLYNNIFLAIIIIFFQTPFHDHILTIRIQIPLLELAPLGASLFFGFLHGGLFKRVGLKIVSW